MVLAVFLGPSTAEAKRRKKRIPDVTPDGQPNIRSEAAIVIDIDTGQLIFEKNPDAEREIASTGKIFVAMAVLAQGLELEATTTITDGDQHAGKGGARSRLAVDRRFSNRDLLAAMLIGSDNRAATALGRAVGLDKQALTKAMTAMARDLGLAQTRFADPSGLKGNVSTARELALALAGALEFPIIAELMGKKSYAMPLSPPVKRQRKLVYRNTNRLLHRDSDVVAGKTGFTTEAGYCLILAATINNRRMAVVFLGGDGKLTRFADYRRLRSWLSTQ